MTPLCGSMTWNWSPDRKEGVDRDRFSVDHDGMKTLPKILLFVVSILAIGAQAADRPGYDLVPSEEALREQITEPLFAFVFSLTDADSLGTWTGDDLLAFAEYWSEESAFPVDQYLDTMTREVLADDAVISHRGAKCDRRWVIRLKPPYSEFPMPFSILGYHPGKLSFNTPIIINEWSLGPRTVHVSVDGELQKFSTEAMTIFQIIEGWIILDVDGWLDKLLGSAADDAVTQGFTACWVDGELVGVGNSVGRKGRQIYGEFNFKTGDIENHGRALAKGISHFSRGWTKATDVDHEDIWSAYDDR